jgi:hypothetical protein
MLHTQQIEEAVELYKEESWGKVAPEVSEEVMKQGLRTLLSLAQEYLAIKGMPEEMPIWDSTEKGKMPVGLKLHSEGFNQALHLCRLAHAKNCRECRERVPTIKELNKIVRENEEYSSSDDRIATAIHTLITGKMKGEVR